MANKEILVVDDEVGIRELLSEILYDEGYSVHLAENAAEARAFRNKRAPDLVLLDIWMPDTDGIGLLREWVTEGQLDMPVIMMSGHGTIETAVEATRIGAVDFLEKPISLKKLLETVSRAIRQGMQSGGGAADQQLGGQAAADIEGAAVDMSMLEQPLREAREQFENLYFNHHMRKENGNITRVAERAGLERTHLYRKLKQLGIKFARKSNDDFQQ